MSRERALRAADEIRETNAARASETRPHLRDALERTMLRDIASLSDERVREAALHWDRDVLWLIVRALARRVIELEDTATGD